MPDFQERTKAQFAVVYLTLISVIQGCVLGYFFVVADAASSTPTWRGGLLFFTSFLLIALVWNEYMMWTTMVRWVLRLPDSLLPLLMGLFQFGMIRAIPSRSNAYFLAAAAFFVTSLVKYRHASLAGRHEPENLPILESLRGWNLTTELMLVGAVALALVAAWLDGRLDGGSGTSPWPALLTAVMPVAYLVRSVIFWRFVCPVGPSAAPAAKG